MCYYNNDILNKPIYGALYNWYAVNNASGLAYLEKNGIQEVGWRVPTDTDFITLSTELGGDVVAGGKLKEQGSSHWSVNVGASNSSGFTALPGGLRFDEGSFFNINSNGYIHGSNEYNATRNWAIHLMGANTDLELYNTLKKYGFTVRLVRDIVVPESLGPEMVDQDLWCAVDLLSYYNWVGANWSGDGTKLTSAGEPGNPLQKLDFWEVGKTYRVVVEVNWISGWFEVYDGFVYTYYITSSGIHTFDVTPTMPGIGGDLYLDSSSFYGDVLSLSIKEIL
jgi:uncharacterized protein (TIGR02145 family)